MKNERVLISGASVGGPALASWLAKFGWDVTVVERAPGIRPGGYAIDFRGSGYRVLERMGLLEAVKAHQTRNGSITMVDENNKVIARLPDGFTSGELEILRGNLANLLYEATRSAATYVFDDSIRSIVQKVDGVEVTFHSGKTDSFDIVVGADGLHSNVRTLAFGEEPKFVRPMLLHRHLHRTRLPSSR
jgi:2-polyprenyl-6-methoxyphenol hydroxylase-like FAD-dependent oxidoreductase